MGLGHSPSIVTNGLVLCLDAANYKSFKGTPATNILNTITFQQANQNGALYKVTNGTETVYIPSLGYVSSKYVDFYNDYGGGSGACCPNLFTYGTGLVVSPNTTYTYSIIYKTTTGYSHPNYMYRYEYNSGGGYVTESGVHSTSNRTSLGDGWWFAWGQFTTQATTATLNTYLFHYEYATQNRIYVYKAALYQGTYIIRPEHMLNSAENRGSTVATGGGWADLSNNGNHGELVNGVIASSDNLGALIFDGIDDYVTTSLGTYTPYCIDIWFYNNDSITSGIMQGNYQQLLGVGTYPGGISLGAWTGAADDETFSFFSAGWSTNGMTYIRDTASPGIHNLVVNWNGSSFDFWLDGTKRTAYSSTAGHRTLETVTGFQIGSAYNNANSYEFDGKIYNVKVYTKQLSDAQVQQNFNALRGRFGI